MSLTANHYEATNTPAIKGKCIRCLQPWPCLVDRLQATVTRLQAENDELERLSELWEWRCCCALDTPDAVCGVHSPAVEKCRATVTRRGELLLSARSALTLRTALSSTARDALIDAITAELAEGEDSDG